MRVTVHAADQLFLCLFISFALASTSFRIAPSMPSKIVWSSAATRAVILANEIANTLAFSEVFSQHVGQIGTIVLLSGMYGKNHCPHAAHKFRSPFGPLAIICLDLADGSRCLGCLGLVGYWLVCTVPIVHLQVLIVLSFSHLPTVSLGV